MKIQPASCGRCSKIIHLVEDAGIRWTLNPEPLDAHQATQTLLSGQELYALRRTREGRPYGLLVPTPDLLGGLHDPSPASRPEILGTHPCPTGAAHALLPASQPASEEKGVVCPKGRQSPAPEAARAIPAEPATPSRSDAPVCDNCSQPCEDGTYASVRLGELTVWAIHTLEPCG